MPRIVKSNLFSQSAQAEREKSQSFIRQLDPGLAKKHMMPGWTLIKMTRAVSLYSAQ